MDATSTSNKDPLQFRDRQSIIFPGRYEYDLHGTYPLFILNAMACHRHQTFAVKAAIPETDTLSTWRDAAASKPATPPMEGSLTKTHQRPLATCEKDQTSRFPSSLQVKSLEVEPETSWNMKMIL